MKSFNDLNEEEKKQIKLWMLNFPDMTEREAITLILKVKENQNENLKRDTHDQK